MKQQWRFRGVVACLLAAGLGLSPAIVAAHGPKSEGTYVTTAPVEVKAGPADGYRTIRRFRQGTTFEIVGKEGAWLKVQLAEHGKHLGYIDQRLAAIKDHHVSDFSPRSAIPAAYVTTAPISVRQGPGEDFPIVATRPTGTNIVVIGLEGEWLRIASGHGSPPEYVSRRSTSVEHAD
jgi:uncharacterized protein YraI